MVQSNYMHRRVRPAFSLAELLVVVGVIALLIAITLPPLELARRQAMNAQCYANLNQLGHALEHVRTTYSFYPLWDDGGTPIRYTWIDVLTQLRMFGEMSHKVGKGRSFVVNRGPHIGYCPMDALPDAFNAARNSDLTYPPDAGRHGVDYSYGISVPLSAGGWAWQPGASADGRNRRFRDPTSNAGRVLVADAVSPQVYNLNGRAVESFIWNDPTQYDNTVAWMRHMTGRQAGHGANVLFQDGHVSRVSYLAGTALAVNTSRTFVWYAGEPIGVNPEDRNGDQWYPDEPPPSFVSNPPGNVLPDALVPRWYTVNQRWTLIPHK